MATRSTIALEYADGTVGQIYCHWDGYLEHNGKILAEHYTDPFKVRALLDGGDTSTLADAVEDCEFYTKRGEELNPQRMFQHYDDYRENAQGEEYNYILRRDGKWYVEFYGEYNGPLEGAFKFQAEENAE